MSRSLTSQDVYFDRCLLAIARSTGVSARVGDINLPDYEPGIGYCLSYFGYDGNVAAVSLKADDAPIIIPEKKGWGLGRVIYSAGQVDYTSLAYIYFWPAEDLSFWYCRIERKDKLTTGFSFSLYLQIYLFVRGFFFFFPSLPLSIYHFSSLFRFLYIAFDVYYMLSSFPRIYIYIYRDGKET